MSLDKVVHVLTQVFSLPIPQNQLEDFDFRAYFKQSLEVEILRLLKHDFEKLIFKLYQIDLNEKETQKIFDLGIEPLIAENLAELIIERQMQKIKSRRQG